jgi:ParB family chromosome partitioning protein
MWNLSSHSVFPHESPLRRQFSSLEELAASIAVKGVLEPIIVRPDPSGPFRYELVAGERRWLASQKPKKDLIPAIVRNLSDQEAKEIQNVENLQREDLHPLEEARGFQSLMESDPETYTVEETAARTGKQDRYVHFRLRLLKLTEDAQILFAADRFTVAHAQELARLEPVHQQEALTVLFHEFKSADAVLKDKHGTSRASVRELREWIKSHCLLDLKNAPFDVRDEGLLPAAGSCVNCPKRAGNNRTLFADIAKGDTCFDSTCFAAKKNALLQIRLDELKAKPSAQILPRELTQSQVRCGHTWRSTPYPCLTQRRLRHERPQAAEQYGVETHAGENTTSSQPAIFRNAVSEAEVGGRFCGDDVDGRDPDPLQPGIRQRTQTGGT